MLLSLKLQKLLTWNMQIKAELEEKELNYLLKHHRLLQLKRFGIMNGFLNDDIRVRVYFYLFNVDKEVEIQNNYAIEQPDLKKIRIQYESVIEADIKRSFNTNKLIKDKSQNDKEFHKSVLKRVLLKFFAKNPQYHYYQGFNAVAGIFVLFYGEDVGLILLSQFAKTMLEDYLIPERFDKYVQDRLQTIKKLVRKICGVELQA